MPKLNADDITDLVILKHLGVVQIKVDPWFEETERLRRARMELLAVAKRKGIDDVSFILNPISELRSFISHQKAAEFIEKTTAFIDDPKAKAVKYEKFVNDFANKATTAKILRGCSSTLLSLTLGTFELAMSPYMLCAAVGAKVYGKVTGDDRLLKQMQDEYNATKHVLKTGLTGGMDKIKNPVDLHAVNNEFQRRKKSR